MQNRPDGKKSIALSFAVLKINALMQNRFARTSSEAFGKRRNTDIVKFSRDILHQQFLSNL